MENKSKMLLIGYDESSGDIPVLTVGTKVAKDKMEILNVFKGFEAKALYIKLSTPDTLPDLVEVDL